MRRALLVLAFVVGCGGSKHTDGAAPSRDAAVAVDGSTPVADASVFEGGAALPPPPADPGLAAIEAERAKSASMTADELLGKYPFTPVSSLGYDPTAATGLDLIAKSSFALNDDERAKLKAHGLVISDRNKFPTFWYGYTAIFAADLPVFISADAILEAVHRSYDKLLLGIEQKVLITRLRSMLTSMRARLGADTTLRAEVRRDLDLHLAVALSLLDDKPAAPVAGASVTEVDALVGAARAATGLQKVPIFGELRVEDFSQFKPRGHYTLNKELEAYFRAMIWLGRVDFRLVETREDGSQRVNRRQLEATLAVGPLLSGAIEDYRAIDRTLEAFIGEADAMTPLEVGDLAAALSVTSPAGIDAIDDATLRAKILDGGFGTQRIASHVMLHGPVNATRPLSSSFLLLGQRYVLDAHVLANVVHDRVKRPPHPLRMMPNALDVAFAALRNDQAATLLKPELTMYGYAPDLHMMRFLADAHPPAYFEANLYNLWLGALRALSPRASEVAAPKAAGLPTITGTDAWGRRLLNTQLDSWAELRHDTVLYAKQSYTGAAGCTFPDAYVDPYPELYARLEAFAIKGRALVESVDKTALVTALWWFDQLAETSKQLRAIATQQRAGTPLTAEQLKWFDGMVRTLEDCVPVPGGWYAALHYEEGSRDAVTKTDPVIADVHTQPTDEFGATVGKVLHVATGIPRAMVVTFDTCTGPRAYVGLVSSYFEKTTRDFTRVDDAEWRASLGMPLTHPADVPWMSDLVAR